MGDWWSSVMQDNGGFFLSAYGVVAITLSGYVMWLRSRLSAASRSGGAPSDERR